MDFQQREHQKVLQCGRACLDNGDISESVYGGQGEYPERSKGLARHAVRNALALRTNPSEPGAYGNAQRWWARVERGTYAESEHGPEFPLEWEPDEEGGSPVGWYFSLLDDGTTYEEEL